MARVVAVRKRLGIWVPIPRAVWGNLPVVRQLEAFRFSLPGFSVREAHCFQGGVRIWLES